jgi:hypothetical protein
LKIVILENERATARALDPGGDSRRPDREALLAEMARRADAGRGGRRTGIFAHSLRQQELRHEAPWPVKFGRSDLASRVVAHLDRALAQSASAVEPLGERWNVTRGIETGADAYTRRISKRLSPESLSRMSERSFGSPIMELPAGHELEQPWRDVPELLARSIEATGILYGALDEDAYTHLVWIGRDDDVPEPVKEALEPWKPILATRAEFVRNARRRWFETAWARDRAELQAPKVIALYRTDRGRIALDEHGTWQPSNKATLCTAKGEGQSVAYLCGLLNSEVLDLWYAVRGKRPRDVWRNYEPKPMARIPYVHIDGLASREPDRTAPAAAVMAASDKLLASPARPLDLARGLEDAVRALCRNRAALLPYRDSAPGLGATVKDPWRTPVHALDPQAIVQGLPTSETVSARLDSTLALHFFGDGPLGRPVSDGPTLRLMYGRQTSATVAGPPDRLALLEQLLEGRQRFVRADLESLVLPKHLAAFAVLLHQQTGEIDRLLDDGRELVERAERITCRLYGVSAELEDEIVAHAVARAARSAPSDGESSD